MYDVAIIGAGAVGSSIARELSKYNLRVCVLEKDQDISNGTSKANSGIVHGGYDAQYGSLKAKLNVEGNRMFKELDNALHFGFNQCGSYVLGFDDNDYKEIQKLYDNGKKNSVEVQIVDRDFVLSREPHVSQGVKWALYCPSAGIISPWEYTIAMAENAALNGVDFCLNHQVTSIEIIPSGFKINTTNKTIDTKYIVNAAGLYSDKIANMGGINSFTITPRKGEYLLFDKELKDVARSVLFQTPKKGSKGILVTPTYHGNLMVGPTADTIDDKCDLSTTRDGLDEVARVATITIPDIDYSKIITQFAGLRASTSSHDFIIEESEVKGFINVAGIDSPGLSASPAIAVYVREILSKANLELNIKENFISQLTPITKMEELSIKEKNTLIEKDPRYGRIICRCEGVSQGEIVEAIHRPIPATTIDSIKRRVRTGAGRCQGGFCMPRVMEIMEKELKKSVLDIEKSEPRSTVLVDTTKNKMEGK